MQTLGIPFLLLVSVWGAFSVVLKAIEMLNFQRDKIIDISENGRKLNVDQKTIILKNDFIPLDIGTAAFLFILTLIIFFLPHILKEVSFFEKLLCYIVGAFTAFTTLAVIVTGINDTKQMKKYLNSLRVSENT